MQHGMASPRMSVIDSVSQDVIPVPPIRSVLVIYVFYLFRYHIIYFINVHIIDHFSVCVKFMISSGDCGFLSLSFVSAELLNTRKLGL